MSAFIYNSKELRCLNTISALLLLVYFPITFVVSILNARYGFFLEYRGHYFYRIFVLFFSPLAMAYVYQQIMLLKGIKFDWKNLGFYFFCVVVAVYLFSYRIVYGEIVDYGGSSVFRNNAFFLVRSCLFFIIGYYFNWNVNRKFLLLLWIICMISVILVTNWSKLGIQINDFICKDMFSSYIFWGDTFAFISILMILNNKGNASLLLITMSSIALFFINSRASFYCFITAWSVFFLLQRRFFSLASLAFMTVLWMTVFGMLGSNNRMFNTLFDTLATFQTDSVSTEPTSDYDDRVVLDNSLVERVGSIKFGLKDIAKNIVFGEYLGQLKYVNGLGHTNRFGYYMHTYLSIWRQFGLAGFSFFVFYFLILSFQSLKQLTSRKAEPAAKKLAVLFVFVALLIMFMRSYTSVYFWFLVGTYLSISNTNLISKEDASI